MPATSEHRGIATALLRWYDRHARDLPWRRTRDAYAVWVSEIMLQQTRVETVIPYWERFLARFPTVAELAAAPLDDVLHQWQGLGYYRRARQLHLAAAEVVERYGGELPSQAAELATLKGIGRYTAGAVASIAFGEATPVVDGNVARVLARLFALEDDVKSTAGQRVLWSLAGDLVDEERPGDFNQALMELGATVCTPTSPRCGTCPVARACRAHAEERVAELPRVAARTAPRELPMVAAVVEHGGSSRILLAQRRAEGLFGGLWEPPMVEGEELAGARGDLARRGVAKTLPLRVVGDLEHVLSHRRLQVKVAFARRGRAHRLRRSPSAPYVALRWAHPGEVALSKLARRVLAVAADGSRQEALF